MINRKQGNSFIPCPDCKTNIPFDPLLLLKGVEFTCPTCKSMIGLATESVPQVQSALNKLNDAISAHDSKIKKR
jgi:Transcription initiation factor IIE, alpha subunit